MTFPRLRRKDHEMRRWWRKGENKWWRKQELEKAFCFLWLCSPKESCGGGYVGFHEVNKQTSLLIHCLIMTQYITSKILPVNLQGRSINVSFCWYPIDTCDPAGCSIICLYYVVRKNSIENRLIQYLRKKDSRWNFDSIQSSWKWHFDLLFSRVCVLLSTALRQHLHNPRFSTTACLEEEKKTNHARFCHTTRWVIQKVQREVRYLPCSYQIAIW